MKFRIIDIVLKLAYIFNYIIPKDPQRVIFYSSPDYSDNCRAMYEKMVEKGISDDYKIVWVVKEIDKCKKMYPNIKFVKHRSLLSLYYMSRSRYIIRTHSFWGNLYIKNKQVMCVAWHGMQIKGFTKSAFDKPRNGFDHFNVTSPAWADVFSKVWNADINRFDVVGMPRNDYLFCYSPDLIEKMNLNSFEKLVLWMPTFRSNKSGEPDGVESELGIPTLKRSDLIIINDYLKSKNVCLLLKLHPWALFHIGTIKYSNIRVISNDDICTPYTLYHLIGEMDALISDYSSVWIDFLLCDKPIGFAYDDLEEYMKTRTMPFVPIEEYMPGMKMHNAGDLIHFIDSLFEVDRYKEERERVRKLFCTYNDANSSERFLKVIGILK